MNKDRVSYFEVNITHDISDKKNIEEKKSDVNKEYCFRNQIFGEVKGV